MIGNVTNSMSLNKNNSFECLKRLLLDSSLITPVRFSEYDYKIVRCGNYTQIYFYSQKKSNNSNIENLDINGLKSISLTSDNKNLVRSNSIRYDNITRTKLNCQRLAKANSVYWKSFITLTYALNMVDIKKSKKDLEYFITNIKKVKKDFKYICIPEFQKRGAIHFHLLTNLTLQDNYIIYKQKDNDKYYDIKYWNKGFVKIDFVENDLKKIIGYISKYMTKECDNRLFGFKRFTSSQNLIKPIIEYVNTSSDLDTNYLINLLSDSKCIYNNIYKDIYNNDVTFYEFYTN